MQALQRTLEFEEELAEKFSGGTTTARNKELESDDENEGTEHNKIVSDIRKKYEKKLGVPNDEAEQVFAAYLLSLNFFLPLLIFSFQLFCNSLLAGQREAERFVSSWCWG